MLEEPRAAVAKAPLLRPYMPELDAVRGIAVLLVLFFHGFFFRYGDQGLSPLPRLFVAATATGWVGVNLFFVLSGFLITGILLDSKGKKSYYRSFYGRRALRILPLYYAVLIVLGVISHFMPAIRHVSWTFLGLSFFYLANVTPLLGVPMQYGVLWSLAVEEHFYLIWPTAVRRLSRHGVVVAGLGICVLCPALRALYYLRHFDLGTGYTWLVADGLGTGAILAALSRGRWGARSAMRWLATALLAVSLTMFVVGYPFGILRAGRFAGVTFRDTALNFLFGGVITFVLLVGASPWKTLVIRPWLRFFGEISYGLYLVHMLVFDAEQYFVRHYFPRLASASGHFESMVVMFVAAAGFATAITYLSRRYFEGFFLQLKRHF